MTQRMLTTADNPWSPFTQFDEWNTHDMAEGYHTLSYLARVLDARALDGSDQFYNELPDDERDAVYESVVDEIVEINDGVYRTVESGAEDDPPDGDDVDEEDEVDEEPADDAPASADPQTRSRVLVMLTPAPDVADDDEVDEREWDEVLVEMREAGIDLGVYGELRALGVGDNQLKRYWIVGKGLKRWRFSPHPWTRLRNLLRKHVGPGRAERMASEWFHLVFGYWPGSDLHRVGSGKPPRGKVIGPG
jgi:hypothetical protein